jgi:hypothetical protein
LDLEAGPNHMPVIGTMCPEADNSSMSIYGRAEAISSLYDIVLCIQDIGQYFKHMDMMSVDESWNNNGGFQNHPWRHC